MRIAAVGDVHGHQNVESFARDLDRLEEPDVFLLAGDTTDHNDLDAFGLVVAAVRDRVSCPVYAVFGNNEYSQDHPRYRERFGAKYALTFLDDDVVTVRSRGQEVRLVGSTGSLDRPTWWQRKNLPEMGRVYEERVAKIEQLLDTPGMRILLTHYPPTWATMGEEKEDWRPELGSAKVEAVIRRRRPEIVIHGHIHKGIPFATLGSSQRTLEAFGARGPIPVYNVAYPVTRGITTIQTERATLL